MFLGISHVATGSHVSHVFMIGCRSFTVRSWLNTTTNHDNRFENFIRSKTLSSGFPDSLPHTATSIVPLGRCWSIKPKWSSYVQLVLQLPLLRITVAVTSVVWVLFLLEDADLKNPSGLFTSNFSCNYHCWESLSLLLQLFLQASLHFTMLLFDSDVVDLKTSVEHCKTLSENNQWPPLFCHDVFHWWI